MAAPIFSTFDAIYPGPHQAKDGTIDPRTWFHIPIELNIEDATITYLIFPFGGTDSEVKEVVVSAAGTWIG